MLVVRVVPQRVCPGSLLLLRRCGCHLLSSFQIEAACNALGLRPPQSVPARFAQPRRQAADRSLLIGRAWAGGSKYSISEPTTMTTLPWGLLGDRADRLKQPDHGNPLAVMAHGVLKQPVQCAAVMVAQVLRLWRR